MRVLYGLIFLCVHEQMSPMKESSTISDIFAKSLLCVAGKAQLERAQKNKKSEQIKDGTKVVQVPQKLIALVVPHAEDIITSFDCASSGIKPLSNIIVEYIEDEYAWYRNLCFMHFDGYEQVIRLYPCVKLTFDEDGHNLHAQLGASQKESSLQLVRWDLFEDKMKFEQLQDYELGPQISTSDMVSQQICAEYMWWKAITINTFKGKEYSPVNLLQVCLYYNLAHVIKALLP